MKNFKRWKAKGKGGYSIDFIQKKKSVGVDNEMNKS